MEPLLSIVVPTKNRYKYLKYLIELIHSFNSEELELVIQDNSDDNTEINKFLSTSNWKSIRYFYSNKKLSMSENSDQAIMNSRGEYVCFIGDDDGVCHTILDCVNWMKNNNIDAVRCDNGAYFWNDYNKKNYRTNFSNALLYKKCKYSYRLASPLKNLTKALKKGLQYPCEMPFLYHGIIKRSVLDKLYFIGHTFFPGGSPDMSNGVSLCFFVKRYAIIDIPVIINGTSNMTGGGIFKRKIGKSPLEEVSFISKSVIDKWEPTIPRIWCGRFAWPESGLKGLRYVKQEEYIKIMNYEYMYACAAVFYGETKLGLKNSRNKSRFLFLYVKLTFTRIFKTIKNKIFYRLTSKYNGYSVVKKIDNIIIAEKNLTEHINKFIQLTQIK